MRDFVHFVGDVARRHNVPPQVITGLFYRNLLDGTACPVVNGRRVIPENYLPEIARVLAATRPDGAGKEVGQ